MAKIDPPPVRQRVGATLRTLREDRGLSLVTVADAASISPSHLSRVERGRTVPGYDVLARIADALDVDLGDLTADERATRDVDAVIDGLALSPSARADLLRTGPARLYELVTVRGTRTGRQKQVVKLGRRSLLSRGDVVYPGYRS